MRILYIGMRVSAVLGKRRFMVKIILYSSTLGMISDCKLELVDRQRFFGYIQNSQFVNMIIKTILIVKTLN